MDLPIFIVPQVDKGNRFIFC